MEGAWATVSAARESGRAAVILPAEQLAAVLDALAEARRLTQEMRIHMGAAALAVGGTLEVPNRFRGMVAGVRREDDDGGVRWVAVV